MNNFIVVRYPNYVYFSLEVKTRDEVDTNQVSEYREFPTREEAQAFCDEVEATIDAVNRWSDDWNDAR